MTRVAIDLTPLQRHVTGCDRYFLELVAALAAGDDGNEYVVFLNRGDVGRLPAPLPARFRTVALPFRGRAARLVFQQAVLPLWLRHSSIDVLHSPSFFTPLAPTRARHAVTVHDLTFFSLPHTHSRLRRSLAFRAGVRASIRRADLVIVPSQATADDVRRLVPTFPAAAIRVVPLGVAPRFHPRAPTAIAPVLARFGLTRPYLLHVGTLEPRKNLLTLLDAYRALLAAGRTDHDLVLVGRTAWGDDSLRRSLATPELAGRVHQTGYVPDDDLSALYAGASLFVFPSFYEGFGLPPLEAMACGTPVLASSAGALAETLAGAAVQVDPNPATIGTAVARLLDDAVALARLRAAGLERAAQFSWETHRPRDTRLLRRAGAPLTNPLRARSRAEEEAEHVAPGFAAREHEHPGHARRHGTRPAFPEHVDERPPDEQRRHRRTRRQAQPPLRAAHARETKRRDRAAVVVVDPTGGGDAERLHVRDANGVVVHQRAAAAAEILIQDPLHLSERLGARRERGPLVGDVGLKGDRAPTAVRDRRHAGPVHEKEARPIDPRRGGAVLDRAADRRRVGMRLVRRKDARAPIGRDDAMILRDGDDRAARLVDALGAQAEHARTRAVQQAEARIAPLGIRRHAERAAVPEHDLPIDGRDLRMQRVETGLDLGPGLRGRDDRADRARHRRHEVTTRHRRARASDRPPGSPRSH